MNCYRRHNYFYCFNGWLWTQYPPFLQSMMHTILIVPVVVHTSLTDSLLSIQHSSFLWLCTQYSSSILITQILHQMSLWQVMNRGIMCWYAYVGAICLCDLCYEACPWRQWSPCDWGKQYVNNQEHVHKLSMVNIELKYNEHNIDPEHISP